MRRKSVQPAGSTEDRTVAFASFILALSLISFLWPRFHLTSNHHPQLDLGPRPAGRNSNVSLTEK